MPFLLRRYDLNWVLVHQENNLCAEDLTMKHIKPTLILCLILASCGKLGGENGFFSDANICRPIANTTDIPIDLASGKVAIPAPTTSAISIAQLTTPETSKKSVWGIEFLLSNTLIVPSKISVSTLIKRSQISGAETATLGPDGETAMKPLMDPVEMWSESLSPVWVKAQLPAAISLESGQSLWITGAPSFGGDQSLAMWLTRGAGLYVAPGGTPIYAQIPNVKVHHRLVYCE